MYYYEDEYQRLVAELWNRYIKNGEDMPEEAPHGIRPLIFESWKRSRRHGVSYPDVKNALLSDAKLSKIIAQNEQLMSVAHSYIRNLYALVAGSNFIIALTDSSGNVIDLVGVEGMIETRAKKSSLAVGCNRSEKYSGTCGIGTCLTLKTPVQIWGYEHYIEPHHRYVCSAAPVKNKCGEIIASIDVIGPDEASSPHTLAMVCAAVDGIEKELKMRDAYENLFVLNNQLAAALETINSGIIMFDGAGTITQHNKHAAGMLSANNDMHGRNITDIVTSDARFSRLTDLDENIADSEITVVTGAGAKLNLSVSVSVIRNELGEKRSTVLVLDEQRKLHKIAARLSGFTANYTFGDIIGSSDDITEIKHLGRIAAKSDSTVLILGENGVGKDMFAQAIHNAGKRSKGPFIPINCASLPKGLVESVLFGYESHSFTGALKNGQPGRFELADGGTIFLDEIGDMPMELQASLLRVLQSKTITRIGGKNSIAVDVRVIAATNLDLAALVEKKRFRPDLYYRLNVLNFQMPPLRRHISDIPLLAAHFIEICNARMGSCVKGISEGAMRRLKEYDWPGNVRELENIIERAMHVMDTDGDIITENELSGEVTGGTRRKQPLTFTRDEPDAVRVPAPNDDEYSLIASALSRAHGNVTKASSALGISKNTLYRCIRRYGIQADDYRL
ncbi:MAG: sigma 54-interacting transcriptional regulator [Clostridiales Family XIII bacterium]|jgi:transcriptional regulator of acetoin/glycerol metabolism|nr:sigma 54-interacting transcriptional regulator [Clostridiales Family XIII bacterium]